MRHIIFLLTISLIIMSCGQTDTKQKELELKERELALKEKELLLKQSDTVTSRIKATDTAIKSATPIQEEKLDLPFIGKKDFETMPGISGSGTPHRYIEIMQNGDVFFGFIQENQADRSVTKERYFAGKFTTYMKCFFKKWDNETSYYKIANGKIYQVDKNNKMLTGMDCCGFNNQDLEDKCPCEDKLY